MRLDDRSQTSLRWRPLAHARPDLPPPSWADPAAPHPARIKDVSHEWVATVLQHDRNLFHQNPDGSWSVRRSNPPLTMIDGGKKDSGPHPPSSD
jgi:hypothetical protein